MNTSSNTETILSTAAEHHQQTLQLLQSASYSINILCHDLSNRIYNHPDIADALASFISKDSANRKARIIVQDVDSIVSSDHKILHVYRRLSSSVQIQQIAKQHEHFTESFILVDNKRYINRADYTLYEGILSDNPFQAKVLLNLFNELWPYTQESSALKQLYI